MSAFKLQSTVRGQRLAMRKFRKRLNCLRAGGERAAAIYTIIQTCKANGIDPQAYITDVIARVADDWPASLWDELMPWNWMPPADQPNAQAA